MHATDIPNFEKLTDTERWQLAGELIASLRDPESVPAPLEHQKILDQRWAEFEKNPDSALSEEQFWSSVEAMRRSCGS